MPLRNLIIVAITVLVSFACYTLAAKNRYANLFAEALEVVEHEALRVVPEQQLFISAMNGMMKQLDEHSAFIAGDRFQQFDEEIRQEFGGVGMYVETNPTTKRLFVLSPMPGTPAFAAGLQIGDEIIEIDGKNVEEQSRADAVKLLRGPVNSPVELTLERDGKRLKKKLLRAAISVPSVNGDYRLPDGGWQYVLKDHPRIGYIRLTQFGEKSAEEIRDVLKQSSKELEALILDLRNNPGGLLNVAVEICDLFVDKDSVIVTTRGRSGRTKSSYSAKVEPIVRRGLPIVVLVNRYSASASEIVAGCLQDHHCAVVVGEQTWGKGTVQDVIPMQRGTSALKLTTSSYWRPSGKHIDRHDEIAIKTKTWGVHPDEGFLVEQTEAEIFDDLRFRSIRDLEGLVAPENQATFDSIKRLRLNVSPSDVDPEPADDATINMPGLDETEPAETKQSELDTEPPISDNGPMEDLPHVDRPLERAIDYFKKLLAKKQIAA